MPLAQDEAVAGRILNVVRVNIEPVVEQADQQIGHGQVAADVHRPLIHAAQVDEFCTHLVREIFQA